MISFMFIPIIDSFINSLTKLLKQIYQPFNTVFEASQK